MPSSCRKRHWYRTADENWRLLAPWAGARISVPALYIAGTSDSVVRFRGMDQLIPNLRLHVPKLTKTLMLERCEAPVCAPPAISCQSDAWFFARHWAARMLPSSTTAANAAIDKARSWLESIQPGRWLGFSLSIPPATWHQGTDVGLLSASQRCLRCFLSH